MANSVPIDLYSDTASKPTPAMLEAMMQAPLGDEQRGTDPTVHELERRVAQLLGKPAAVLLPTATMANQIALAVHCTAGDEVLCHHTAHVYNFEAGGVATTARAQVRPLSGPAGVFHAPQLDEALRSTGDTHLPRSRVVVVENTSNGGGGSVWPDAAFLEVVEFCKAHKLALHIDGARLMNASTARRVAPSHWGQHADSVQLCFSKGLGCPMGAVLAVNSELELGVRRWKQRLGGALRQAGLVAGAMLYALDHNVERLAEDHRRAADFATELRHAGFDVPPVQSNLVYFSLPGVPASVLAEQLRRHGVIVSGNSGQLRACFYLGIGDTELEQSLARIRAADLCQR